MSEIGVALQMAVIFIGLPWTVVGCILVLRRPIPKDTTNASK